MDGTSFAFGLPGLFTACVDCFKLVQWYRSRRQDYDVLQTMLDNQQVHLMAWGRACGFMETGPLDSRFDDPLSAARNMRIEKIIESIQSLLTNTDKLRNRYGLRPCRQMQGVPAIESSSPSAFERAFQNTKDFWNASLQTKFNITGSILWTVNDKERFTELIDELSKLVEDLNKPTEDMGLAVAKGLVVEYEMEIIGDEGSLEAIAEASTCDDGDDMVSRAARRQLQHVKQRTVLTQGLLRPDDSVSVFSRRQLAPPRDITESETLIDDDGNEMAPPIGLHRVNDEDWRKVKTRQGIIPWLPTLLVSMAAPEQIHRAATMTEADNTTTAHTSNATDATPPSKVPGWASRLAINSSVLLEALRTIIGAQLTAKPNVLVFPFNLLDLYQAKIRAACAAIASQIPDKAATLTSAEQDIPDDEDGDAALKAKLPDTTSLKAELDCLVDLMNSDLAELFKPCGGAQDKVAFDRLWSVFRPGDILVDAEKENRRAFLLLHVTGGRKILDVDNHSRSHSRTLGGMADMAAKDFELDDALGWTPLTLSCRISTVMVPT